MSSVTQRVWYFSYGSNLDPVRFRSRVGPWHEIRTAVLDGYHVRFSGEVRSEGGGGAFVEPAEGGAAFGAVFLIDPDQLQAMDEIELRSGRNVAGLAIRRQVEVRTPAGIVKAEMYTLPAGGTYLAPSAKYLAHILDGLRASGHTEEVLEQIRATAADEPLTAAASSTGKSSP